MLVYLFTLIGYFKDYVNFCPMETLRNSKINKISLIFLLNLLKNKFNAPNQKKKLYLID